MRSVPTLLLSCLVAATVVSGPAHKVLAADKPAAGKTIQLFNGKNLDGWYTYTKETQRENPGIFTVVDGMLRISGGEGDKAYFGGIITEKPYENYHLVVEYKWGGPTFGARKDKARDSGILLHCVGPDGPGPWPASIECQIIEGGDGDFILVGGTGDDGKPVKHSLTAEAEKKPTDKGMQLYYSPGAPKVTFSGQRLNWWGRDPKWDDVVDFRGKEDVSSPVGEWTRIECICKGDKLTYKINGKVVNEGSGAVLTKGKILIQTEGAEMFVRKVELTPLQ